MRWLLTPVVNWWGFVGTIPALVYAAFGLVFLLVLIRFIQLFK